MYRVNRGLASLLIAAITALTTSDVVSAQVTHPTTPRAQPVVAVRPSVFSVFGRVTDDRGKPMSHVTVRAATGMGTLWGGANTETDADGNYRLYFGAGLRGEVTKESPLGVGTQCACFFASKPGWSEVNLNQAGDRMMSDATPQSYLKNREVAGAKEADPALLERVVFPHTAREINFKLTRAATIRGEFPHGLFRRDVTLCLVGDELPPASNVLNSAQINPNGEFEFPDVPMGKVWRFAFRIPDTRFEVESEPFTVERPDVHVFKVSLESKPAPDGGVTLRLKQRRLTDP